MLKNYWKVALRNILKHRQFTLLNLLGLSTGLACITMIYLWVSDERGIDRFNRNDDRLFQVLKTVPNSDGVIDVSDVTQGLLASELQRSFPEIEHAVSVRRERDLGILSFGEKRLRARWQFAQKDFFNIFTYPLLAGDRHTVLNDKQGVLLSDQLALKLFHAKDASCIGRTIGWDGGPAFSGPYVVTGIFEAPPANATQQFDMVFSYDLYAEKEIGTMGDISNWGSNSVMTYLLLKPGVAPALFAAKIRDFTKKRIEQLSGSRSGWEGDLLIQRYSDRYLYNHFENGRIAGGRIEYIRLFSVIAIFILVIACINFMNLATARAAARVKEVGVRKVIGATRLTLIGQYIGESMLMSFASLAIALLLAYTLLPAFRQITGKDLRLELTPAFLWAVLAITLITGLIAGSYPALYISGFKPVSILKGQFTPSAKQSWVRRGLVTFQFSISIVLIIAVMVVYRQMKLVQTRNLGYSRENIIRFTKEGSLQNNQQTFLAGVKSIPGVVDASGVNGDLLGQAGHSGGGIDWPGKDPALGIEYYGIGVDHDFMQMLDLRMAEGRDFSAQFGSDSNAVIFNQAAIRAMGLKDPVGKTVSLWGHQKKIIGIVKDFHFESLYKKLRPMFIEYSPENANILVKLAAGREKETLARLEKFYKQFNRGLPFEYTFLDEEYQKLYASEQRVAMLSRYFAGLAIIISCLGLFGLTAFTVRKRQKEIGIRKVIGASAPQVIVLLSKDFMKLVTLAIAIAFPLSAWLMNAWLHNFAYRIPIGWDIFAMAGISIISITLLTISFQSIRAALANPVHALRSE